MDGEDELKHILKSKKKKESGQIKEKDQFSMTRGEMKFKSFWNDKFGQFCLVKNFDDSILEGKLVAVNHQNMGVVIEDEKNYVVIRGSNIRSITFSKKKSGC